MDTKLKSSRIAANSMASKAKTKPFISAGFALPVAAVIGLVAIFVIYYFVIITRREASFDDRAFRVLAAVSLQFRDLVSTYGTVFQGAARQGGGRPEETRARASKPQAPSSTKLSISPQRKLVPASKLTPSVQTPNILNFLSAQGSKLTDVGECQSVTNLELLLSPEGKTKTTASVAPGATAYNLEIASNGWCAYVPFETLLSPLVTESLGEIFDDVILADASGTVLYQTTRSGVVVDDLAILSLEFDAKESSSAASATKDGAKGLESPAKADPSHSSDSFSRTGGSSSLYRVSLGGASYRVYLVPVRLPIPRPSASGTAAGVRLVLCGLMVQKHFTTQSRSLPLTFLTAITLAALLVIVGAWPVLKFLTMRRSESVTRRAGFLYVISIAVMVMVMIVLVIHLNYGFSDPKTDNNMEDLARAIDRNVGLELSQALVVMESLGANPAIRDADVLSHDPHQPCTDQSDGKDPLPRTNLLSTVGMEVADYPYFRRIYVYDSKGFEHVRWTVDVEPPPPLRVCDRPYFQGVQRNDLWYLSGQGLSGARFRVDPLYSKSTGEYLAAIAQPYTIRKAPKESGIGVMLMVTPMLSLINPVLPPDYGFAVIDSAGKVLFHSDSTKNGREMFFNELQDSRPLRAAVLVSRPTWLRGNYMGRDYGLYVTPLSSIQGCPWSLLVFSDRAVLGDKAVERTLVVGMLSTVYLAMLVAVAALLRLFLPRRNLLWPMAKMRGCYCELALVLALIIVLTYGFIFEASPKEILYFAVLIPTSAVVFSVLRIQNRLRAIRWTAGILGGATFLNLVISNIFQGDGWTRSPYLTLLIICAAFFSLGTEAFARFFDNLNRPNVATAYSLGCFALLVLVAGIPCISFFKFAYDYDESLATRRQQLLTLAALNRREERVIGQYFRVHISGENVPFADDLGKWLFLRRRLQEQKFDLYDKAFRDQAVGQVMAASDTPRWPAWWVRFARDRVPRHADSLSGLMAEDCVERSRWRWSEAGMNRMRIQPLYKTDRSPGATSPCFNDVEGNQPGRQQGAEDVENSPETLALHKLALQDPIFLVQDLTYHTDALRPWDFVRLTAFPFGVPLLAAIFLSVRSTITKMFLLKWRESEVWNKTTLPEAIGRTGNRILVGLPKAGKTEFLRNNSGTVGTIDVAVASQIEKKPPVPSQQTVALDHFEYGMFDHAITKWKLACLEELVQAGKSILIVTTIDPGFYFENAAEDPWRESETMTLSWREKAQWARILATFETLRLIGMLSPDATSFYDQLLWSTCTWGEKITLYPLAQDGWANYKNHRSLQHLLNRGLIEVDPEIHLTDQEFAKFISGGATKAERKSWLVRDTSGIWDAWRTTLIVVVLGALAAVMFFSQKDFWGIVSGAAGALTAATKIISDFRSPRTGGGRDKVQAT
jgi:hypothetical protein